MYVGAQFKTLKANENIIAVGTSVSTVSEVITLLFLAYRTKNVNVMAQRDFLASSSNSRDAREGM